MKRALAIVLSLLLLVGLVSCSEDKDKKEVDEMENSDEQSINFENLKINCLGASNTRKIVNENKKENLSINYTTMLKDQLHCTVRNYGEKGTNIAKTSSRTDSYVERALDMNKDADIVIFQGEGNDASHGLPLGEVTDTEPTTFCGAIYTVISYIEKTYPDAKLIILSGMSKKNAPKREDKLTHKDFHTAFMNVCRRCGYEPYDFTLDEVIQPSDTEMMPDGLHMSYKACQRYTGIVIEEIKKNLAK